MKLKGKKVEGPNEEVVVIPRGSGDPLVFRAKAVLDYSSFEKLCPEPEPPKVQRPGGEWSANVEDADYKKRLTDYSELRDSWMVLESLRATTDLEWETVDYAKPETWAGWRKELSAAGVSHVEANRIYLGVMRANCLDERVVQAARETFFRGNHRPS